MQGFTQFSSGFHHLTQLLKQLKTNTVKQSNTADIKECEQETFMKEVTFQSFMHVI